MPRPHLRRLVVALSLWLVTLGVAFRVPQQALAQMSPGSGAKIIENPHERMLFGTMLCMCGGCQREPLSSCSCGYADARRSEIRAMIADGKTDAEIQAAYVQRFGTQSLSVPPNTGSNRLLYLVPLGLIACGAVFVVLLIRRFRKRGGGDGDGGGPGAPPVAGGKRDDYDEKLDEELKRLDE
jgi:cytochrome c-type biogenesis protein CcmH